MKHRGSAPPRSAHHIHSRRLSSTLAAQVRSPSVAEVLADGAQMEHHLHRRPGFQKGVQGVRVDDAIRRVAGEIEPLSLATKRVHDDSFQAAPCERRL